MPTFVEFRYKLTADDLLDMVQRHILPLYQAKEIIAAAMQRSAGEHLDETDVVRYRIGPDEGIEISNVQRYGGEDQGDPYKWVAELRRSDVPWPIFYSWTHQYAIPLVGLLR